MRCIPLSPRPKSSNSAATCAPLSPTICRAFGKQAARSTSTDSSATASYWRRRWRAWRRKSSSTMPPSRRSWMLISVNGKPCEVQAETLAALLAELEYEDAVVATARNRDFVRRKDRAQTAIVEGDEIEVLVPRQGG